ncbi:MAG: biotin--[acetyl-CoA-carboxylase] ligase [Clostridia bacterium]|nr:biotin--[acetyl-CoA-carboxylase] ligase [Clostridia bacterium]
MPLKNDILLALETNRGAAVSGQKLAGDFGVSRNAVWKAIKALQGEGYQIEAATRSGYRLADDCDLLSAPGIRAYLLPRYRDLAVFVHPELDSTNNEAKRLLAQGFTGQGLILAESQQAGRGRLGRSFFSPRGSGVYMSLILRPGAATESILPLTTMAAVAVTEAIKQLCGLRPEIKWVNDVYLQGKKICGILTEAESGLEAGIVSSVIVGIGINVHHNDFPPQLTKIAGALNCRGLRRNQLIADVANRLLDLAANPGDHSYLESYRRHSLVLGRDITYQERGEEISARAIAIDELGGLEIELADGSRRVLRSGEISLRLAPR